MGFADHVASADRAVHVHLGSASVVYAPLAGSPETIIGMFDENYVLVDPTDPGIESVGPSVWLSAENIALLPVHPDDDTPTLTIGGTDYKIRESKPEGLGGIRLLLHLVTVP